MGKLSASKLIVLLEVRVVASMALRVTIIQDLYGHWCIIFTLRYHHCILPSSLGIVHGIMMPLLKRQLPTIGETGNQKAVFLKFSSHSVAFDFNASSHQTTSL